MKQVTDIDLGRAALCASLDAYFERHPEEHHTISQLRAFVERERGCFERTTVEGHITGSAWVVDEQRTSTLLTHHRKLNRWLQLGGHADGKAFLVGADAVKITQAFNQAMQMADMTWKPLYGDGKAAEKMATIIFDFLK